MAIDILDGFEDYPAVSTNGVGLLSTWTQEGTTARSLVTGRVGGQALQLTTATGGISRAVTPSAAFATFFGFLHSFAPSNSNYMRFARWYAGGNPDVYHFALGINRFGRLAIYGPAQTIIAEFELAIINNTWHSLSVAGEIHDSLGWLKIWIDGDLIVDLSNIDTKNAAGANVERIAFMGNEGFSDAVSIFDDFRHDSGVSTQIPEGRFAVLTYAADDGVQFTPLSGPSNYLMIDDATNDENTTYNSSNTVGHVDQFTVNALPFNPDNIMAIMVSMSARKEDVATRRIRAFVDSGGVQVDFADTFLSTNYTWDRYILELDPDGDVPWTKAALTALKVGYELRE